MTPPAMLIVRPEPSRGLGAFYRNLGMTMLATHARACGLDPDLVDLTFEDFDEALARGAGVAAFSLYIDDFARGIELAAKARAAGLVTVVGGPHATLLGHDVLTATDAFDLIGIGDCLPEVMPVIARGGSRPATRVIGEGTATARMDSLAPVFRRRVEDEHLACWNLSDYALLCWRSVGGDTVDLARLWQRPDHELNDDQRLVVNVLKEKTGVTLPGQAAGFMAAARRVAAGSPGKAVTG